jgi:uncharacterized protein YifN (PemK superfamily)
MTLKAPMALTFHPKAGMVLVCDFRGAIVPEISKVRPVVVISPNHPRRAGLVTVVPLSTTTPEPVRTFHYRLSRHPIPSWSTAPWAKCDLVTSVSIERLDRVRLGHGKYGVGHVDEEELRQIRLAAARSFGVDAMGSVG